MRLTQTCRALYLKDDPYESTDAVFGVKDSLVVDVQKVGDEEQATLYGVELGTLLIKYDFVLVTMKAAAGLRRKNAEQAMASQGRRVRFIDDLPVPEVD